MAKASNQISVLFVCMGNICRSPTAEGVFRNLVDKSGLGSRIRIDSAGTHGYHQGEPPDRRAQAAAARRGYDLSMQRSRRIVVEDFMSFDIIVAMDHDNVSHLRDMLDEDTISDLRLFLEFANSDFDEVPDPYYGGATGFERVLDLVEDASAGLLRHIEMRLG